jgi:anti-sigma factor RsiW
MNCKPVFSRLHAYADKELPPNLMQEIEEHLNSCSACRAHFEQIRNVGEILDNLSVPTLPKGFAARVMSDAREKASREKDTKPSFMSWWHPVQWVLDLSISMRLAASAMLVLACLLGVFMSREVTQPRSFQIAYNSENLDGFEWFSITPPSSLSSAYVPLTRKSETNNEK